MYSTHVGSTVKAWKQFMSTVTDNWDLGRRNETLSLADLLSIPPPADRPCLFGSFLSCTSLLFSSDMSSVQSWLLHLTSSIVVRNQLKLYCKFRLISHNNRRHEVKQSALVTSHNPKSAYPIWTVWAIVSRFTVHLPKRPLPREVFDLQPFSSK